MDAAGHRFGFNKTRGRQISTHNSLPGQLQGGRKRAGLFLRNRLPNSDLPVLPGLLKIEAVVGFDVLGNTGRRSDSVGARLGAAGNFGRKDAFTRFTAVERA